MVDRMGGGLHFLEEIKLEMAKMPAFTNLNTMHLTRPRTQNHFEPLLARLSWCKCKNSDMIKSLNG